MKRILFFLLLSPAFGFAQSYTLSITNGYGDGIYVKGDTIHVWSKPADANAVFSHWSGNGANYLLKFDEWHSQLIIPSSFTSDSVFLMANYEELDATENGQFTFMLWGELEENGLFFPMEKIVDFAYPTDPKAIVFLIHGTGGNSSSWVERYDRRTIIKDLVHAGYAVFALNSNETTLGDQDGDGKIRWQTDASKQDTSNNIDFKNVIETRNLIIDQLSFEDLPVFMLGGSNGANFSDYATATLDFKASCHMTGNGISAVFENHQNLKPIIWIQSKNDNQSNADSTKAKANYHELLDQGITTEWHWLERSPVHPFRFERSRNNIDPALSTALFEELKNQQLLDSNHYLNILDINAEFPFDDFYSNFNINNLQKRDIEDQLYVLNADHGANGDFNKTIIRFFNDCLGIHSFDENPKQTTINFTLSPNPTSAFLRVESIDQKWLDFEIYSINGKLLMKEERKSFIHLIDVSGFANGAYFIKVKSESGMSSIKKFIKNG